CSSVGAPCDDGNACTTVDQCDANLNCVGGGPAPNCDDGSVCTTDTCVAPAGCVHTPAPASCLLSAKGVLKLVQNTAKPNKNVALFKWLKGDPLTQAQFGDPTTVTGSGYSLCLFDARGVVTIQDVAPAGTCGPKA